MTALPIVLVHDNNDPYWVAVPDLPGCFTHGDSVEHAKSSALEAAQLYLEDSTPALRPLADHKVNPDFAGGIWSAIELSAVL